MHGMTSLTSLSPLVEWMTNLEWQSHVLNGINSKVITIQVDVREFKLSYHHVWNGIVKSFTLHVDVMRYKLDLHHVLEWNSKVHHYTCRCNGIQTRLSLWLELTSNLTCAVMTTYLRWRSWIYIYLGVNAWLRVIALDWKTLLSLDGRKYVSKCGI
jgi:hypothetical protein